MKKILLTTIIMIVMGCTYSVYSSGMPHLKTVKLNEFENTTDQYELEIKLLDSMSEDFIMDGRLNLVDLTPDCELKGRILDYTNKITTYGSSGIDEYEVRVLFSIEFVDLVKNEIIWETSNLVISQKYSGNDNAEIVTEEEAVKEIEQDLFEKIMRESLEEW